MLPPEGRSRPVREHHAPVGALRHQGDADEEQQATRQGAPRTCRCIETLTASPKVSFCTGQGAPRTCRCIETMLPRRWCGRSSSVREHHAPVGALRLNGGQCQGGEERVREHHAPVGALRQTDGNLGRPLRCQGAPRTCRCIETLSAIVTPSSMRSSGSTTHL